jgi:type IV pilus assembly protein PilE
MKTRTIKIFDLAGFTLIEVMITVAVVAILAAVALPNYFDYVTRSRLVEAKTSLVDMRTRLEQYFLDNRAYPKSKDKCVTADKTPASDEIRLPPDAISDSKNKYFKVECTTMTTTTYTVTATGTGSMDGFVFTVNEANERATTGVKTGWAKPNPNTCWAGRKNGDC